MARAWVGTSGWSYAHWRHGVFYPEGLPSGQWLPFLARHFDTVELNVTFYRMPTEAMVASWARKAPPGFRFAAKLWRGITHYRRLAGSDRLLGDYLHVLDGLRPDQRAPVLVQLPPQMHADPGRLDGFLELFGRMARRRWQVAVEFRHPSWLDAGVLDVLDHHGAALCVHDMERAAPVTEPNDAPFVYLRRHGPQARYRGSYSDAHVAADARDVQGWLDQGRDVWAYYNNDMRGHAVRDAKRLRQRLGLPDPRPPEAEDETAPPRKRGRAGRPPSQKRAAGRKRPAPAR
jgi:uncharacterized protein YecE (DUF72 family)